MRLTRRLTDQRLQRVRARARLARTTLASVRTDRREPWPIDNPLPPLPPFAALRCGKRCDAENAQSPGRRSSARTVADTEILLRRLGSADRYARVRDISTCGCQLEQVATLGVNDHVVTRLPGLEPLGATVTWADSGHAGLRFDRPLHPAVFELLLTRLG